MPGTTLTADDLGQCVGVGLPQATAKLAAHARRAPPPPRLTASPVASKAMEMTSQTSIAACGRPTRLTSRRGRSRAPRSCRRMRGRGRIFSRAGMSSPDVRRVNVPSIEASPGSEPTSLLSIESRACFSRELRLITASSIALPWTSRSACGQRVRAAAEAASPAGILSLGDISFAGAGCQHCGCR